MKRRKVLASMGAVTAGGGLAIGSGAFSAAEADRRSNIEVVGDDEALMQIEYSDDVGGVTDGVRSASLCKNGSAELFTLTNEFHDEITVEIESGDVLELETDEIDIPVGEEEEVKVTGSSSGKSKLEIVIEEANGGVQASITRLFDVEWRFIERVEFPGCQGSNPEIVTCGGSAESLGADLIVFDDGDAEAIEIDAEINGNTIVPASSSSDESADVPDNHRSGPRVGVRIPPQHGVPETLTFSNPNFDFDAKNCNDNPGRARGKRDDRWVQL